MEKKIIILAIIVVGVIIWIMAGKKSENEDLSSKAIKLAKTYIEEEKIDINDSKYLYINELIYGSEEAVLFNNCNMASGVLVNRKKDNLEYMPILKCVNFNSINNSNELIKLKGETIVVLNENDSYEEIGYEKGPYDIYPEKKTILDNLQIVNYRAVSGSNIMETASRIILISDNKTINIDGSYDHSFPLLSLVGDEVINISYGDKYEDKGCIATDSLDGDITTDVVKEGEVNSFILGEYNILYKITNSRGNFITKKRQVKVSENVVSSNGTCTATVKRNEIVVNVNVASNVQIINYRYFINNQEESSNNNVLQTTETFTKDNLPTVKVTINDENTSNTSLLCTVVGKFTPEMYIDVNGYNCLEGFVCYKQKDYSAPYQATENGVGTISSSGCLPTSMTIISTKFNKHSLNGNLFTPETLISELIYTQGKIWGYSNYDRVKYIADKLNLKVSEQYSIRKDFAKFTDALKNGNPVIALVTDGCYANSGGHYLTVIGINDNNQIFVSDPYSKTTSSMHKTCTVNAWADINEFVNKGAVNYFAVISE